MKYKQCLIVLIGTNTYSRPWVQYEIRKAWEDKKAMFGIYIHNLECPNTGQCSKGDNPFDILGPNISSRIQCYEPNTFSYNQIYDQTLTAGKVAYRDIETNLENWVESAIENRKIINLFGINN